MPDERPNFFELLDLDPAVDDWPTIKIRLEEKKRAWSRDKSQGPPAAQRRAADNLSRVREIEALLAGEEARRAESKDALRRRQGRREQRLRDLNERIQVLLASGHCTEEQLKGLCTEFSPEVAPDEVRQRLAQSGVRIGPAGGGGGRAAKPVIDKVTAASIKRELAHLGLGSLYEFLDRKPGSSLAALRDRATEIQNENQRIGRIDVTASAQNSLCGLCQTIFRSAEDQERYDNHLAIQSMEALQASLELAGAGGFLNARAMDELIRQARARGVSAEDARAHIEEYAAGRRWGVQREAVPAEQLRACGFCATLCSPASRRCNACGEPLDLACPRCGRSCPSSDAACSSCGCRVGDAPLVRGLAKRGLQLAVEGQIAEAVVLFDKALVYWPEWADAVQARSQALQRLAEQQAATVALETLVRERRLASARAALLRIEGRGGVPVDVRNRIDAGLAEAEAAWRRGEQRRSAGEGEAAVDAFEQALAICADFEPALQALRATPPPAPAGLRLTAQGAAVRLSWQAPSARGRLLYRIVRKAGGGPSDVGDGTVVGEVGGTTFDDADLPVGAPWHYAVFSLRAGVACQEPARGGPHLRTVEVDELTCLAGDSEVVLRWKAPPGCARVEVWRKRGGAPSGPGDGGALAVAGSSARDGGLHNGETYGYLVVAVFRGVSGDDLRTPGRSVTAVPIAPPQAVLDLRALRQGKRVLLSWSPVVGAAVEIRRTTSKPEHAPSLVLPAAEVERLGDVVPGIGAGSAQVKLDAHSRMWFVPVSLKAGTAVVGRSVEVTVLDPVERLCSIRTGGSVLLTWAWPAGSDETLVRWSFEGDVPDASAPAAGQATVSRAEYERRQGWLLRNPERRRHHFAVFARGRQTDLYAPPARLSENLGEAVTVAYRVVARKRLGLGPVQGAWLDLQVTSGATQALPGLMVVGKTREVPTSLGDGELVAEYAAVDLSTGRARLAIPKQHLDRRLYLKLFFKDPAHAREIRLLPAEREGLRAG